MGLPVMSKQAAPYISGNNFRILGLQGKFEPRWDYERCCKSQRKTAETRGEGSGGGAKMVETKPVKIVTDAANRDTESLTIE